MQFISLGCDCQTASVLKERKVREVSSPFDWVVTYHGVSDIIQKGFKDYFPTKSSGMVVHNGVYWMHNNFPKDCEMMKRRCDRFLNRLRDRKSNREIIFIRKGHNNQHHRECADHGIAAPPDDIEDAVRLDAYLTENYPHLKFSIHIVAACTVCFDESVSSGPSVSKNVVVHFVRHRTLFDDKCREIIAVEPHMR